MVLGMIRHQQVQLLLLVQIIYQQELVCIIIQLYRKTRFSQNLEHTLGNGNADGPFVYTGFKPAFVLVKNADDTQNWFLQDSKRAWL